jgi:hypothetical protein
MPKDFVISVIKDGQVANPAPLRKLFTGLKDGRYEVSVKRLNRRSLPQNAYIHGVLFPEFRKALNEVGYDAVQTNEQAKEIAKKMFLTVTIPNVNTGEVIEYTRHTSELSKEEMTIFIEAVIKFTAENMNYIIPYPGESLQFNFDE